MGVSFLVVATTTKTYSSPHFNCFLTILIDSVFYLVIVFSTRTADNCFMRPNYLYQNNSK